MKYIFQFSLSILIILLSVQVVTTKPYMMLHEDKYASHETMTWDYEYAVTEIIGYLNGSVDDLEFPSYEGGTDIVMTERGILHMIDVKVLFERGRILAAVLAVSASITGIALYDRKEIKEALKGLWKIPAVILGFITVAMIIDFRSTFTVFHQLLFSNDLWLLSWTDPLIVMLPTTFFFITAVTIVVLAVAAHAVIIIYAYKTTK